MVPDDEVRVVKKRVLEVALIVVMVIVVIWSQRPDTEPRHLTLVRMGDFDNKRFAWCQGTLRYLHDIEVRVAPGQKPVPEAWIGSRTAYSVPILLKHFGEKYPGPVLVLTQRDLVAGSSPEDHKVMGDAVAGVGVLSSHRIDLQENGWNSSDLTDIRTEKMLKRLGGIVLGTPLSDDPKSVYYRDLILPWQLDDCPLGGQSSPPSGSPLHES